MREPTFNPYELLQIDPAATIEQIRPAYRSAARRHHPDAGGTVAAFQDVERAWWWLSDPTRRETVDATFGQQPAPPPPPPPPPAPTYPPPAAQPGICRARAVTFGQVSAEQMGDRYGAHGAVGAEGEVLTAQALRELDLGPDVYVFHDLTPPGGSGNIDHCLVTARSIVILDSKRWAPGRYMTQNYDDGSQQCWRDRGAGWELFEPGLGTSATFLADKLLEAFGGADRFTSWVRALVVTSSGPLDLRDHRPAGLEVISPSQIGRLVEAYVGDQRGPVDPQVLRRLRAMTNAPATVELPYELPAAPPDDARLAVDGALDEAAFIVPAASTMTWWPLAAAGAAVAVSLPTLAQVPAVRAAAGVLLALFAVMSAAGLGGVLRSRQLRSTMDAPLRAAGLTTPWTGPPWSPMAATAAFATFTAGLLIAADGLAAVSPAGAPLRTHGLGQFAYQAATSSWVVLLPAVLAVAAMFAVRSGPRTFARARTHVAGVLTGAASGQLEAGTFALLANAVRREPGGYQAVVAALERRPATRALAVQFAVPDGAAVEPTPVRTTSFIGTLVAMTLGVVAMAMAAIFVGWVATFVVDMVTLVVEIVLVTGFVILVGVVLFARWLFRA